MEIETRMYKRLWMYFKRGHSQFFQYGLSLINFLGVIFLVIERVFGADLYVVFFVFFIIGYPIIATKFGQWDFSRGGIYPVEAETFAKNHPYYRDLAEAISELAQDRPFRAQEILAKWFK